MSTRVLPADPSLPAAPARLPPREQAKALGLATLGGMLEYFEFLVYVFLAPQISAYFAPPDMPGWLQLMMTFGIFAAGYLVRPIGGIVLAHLGDVFGRKRTFTLTLLLMAVPTTAIGLLPGYAQIGVLAPILLLVCRMLQGLSVGGELPGALSFISEQVPPRWLPLACGVLSASITCGALFGSLVVNALTHSLGAEAMADYGWRIPFLIGGVFGFFSIYLRRFTRETPVFEAMKAHSQLSRRLPFATLMSEHWRDVLLAMVIASMVAAITLATTQFPIAYFVTLRGFDARRVLDAHAWLILVVMLGHLLVGYLSSRTSLLLGFVAAATCAIGALFWAYGQDSVETLVWPFVLLGLSAGSMTTSLALLVVAFPAQVRYTGIATAYNVPLALVGGLSPLLLTWLSQRHLWWAAAYPAAFCVFGVVAALALWPRRHPISPFDPVRVR